MNKKICLKDKKLEKIFYNPQACEFEINAEGLVLTATENSRDPFVFVDIPFGDFKNAEDLGAIAVRMKTERPGYFEIYFTAGEITVPTAFCQAGESYEGGGQREVVLCKLIGKKDYSGTLHSGFRIDWANYCRPGDKMVIEEIILFDDDCEAEAFAEKENKNRKPFEPNFTPEPLKLAKPLDIPGYYVCLYDKRLDTMTDGNILARFDTLDEAKALCDKQKVYGFRVTDESGNVVYSPYTLLQCDILREGKYVTDFARTNGFLYGDAPINPGIDCEAKLVSCDRLVCCVLYRLGFTHQQYTQGVVVSAFPAWCEKNGFIKLDNYETLEPGDIMLVRPHPKGFPQHAFLFAGYCEKPENEPDFPACVADPNAPAGPEVPEMYSYRYDCGSNARIQSVQPSQERLFKGAYTPVALYRPVATKENCLNYLRYGNN